MGKMHCMKVALLGDSGAGKTAAVRAFSGLSFDGAYVETAESKIWDCLLPSGEASDPASSEPAPATIRAQFWDCGASALDESRLRRALDGALCALLMYDLTNYASYESVCTHWLQVVRRASPDAFVVLVGCKSDLALKGRAVHVKQVEQLANANGVFFMEMSAKSGVNVELTLSILRLRAKHTMNQQALGLLTAPEAGQDGLSFPDLGGGDDGGAEELAKLALRHSQTDGTALPGVVVKAPHRVRGGPVPVATVVLGESGGDHRHSLQSRLQESFLRQHGDDGESPQVRSRPHSPAKGGVTTTTTTTTTTTSTAATRVTTALLSSRRLSLASTASSRARTSSDASEGRPSLPGSHVSRTSAGSDGPDKRRASGSVTISSILGRGKQQQQQQQQQQQLDQFDQLETREGDAGAAAGSIRAALQEAIAGSGDTGSAASMIRDESGDAEAANAMPPGRFAHPQHANKEFASMSRVLSDAWGLGGLEHLGLEHLELEPEKDDGALAQAEPDQLAMPARNAPDSMLSVRALLGAAADARPQRSRDAHAPPSEAAPYLGTGAGAARVSVSVGAEAAQSEMELQWSSTADRESANTGKEARRVLPSEVTLHHRPTASYIRKLDDGAGSQPSGPQPRSPQQQAGPAHLHAHAEDAELADMLRRLNEQRVRARSSSSAPDLFVDVNMGGKRLGAVPVREGDNPALLAAEFVRRHGLPVGMTEKLTRLLRARVAAFYEAELIATRDAAREQQRADAARQRHAVRASRGPALAGNSGELAGTRSSGNGSRRPSSASAPLSERAVIGTLHVKVGRGRIGKLVVRVGDDPHELVKSFGKTFSLRPQQAAQIQERLVAQLRLDDERRAARSAARQNGEPYRDSDDESEEDEEEEEAAGEAEDDNEVGQVTGKPRSTRAPVSAPRTAPAPAMPRIDTSLHHPDEPVADVQASDESLPSPIRYPSVLTQKQLDLLNATLGWTQQRQQQQQQHAKLSASLTQAQGQSRALAGGNAEASRSPPRRAPPPPPPHEPLFNLDINLGPTRTERIQVCEGDDLGALAQRFCLQHRLSPSKVSRVRFLLEEKLALHERGDALY